MWSQFQAMALQYLVMCLRLYHVTRILPMAVLQYLVKWLRQRIYMSFGKSLAQFYVNFSRDQIRSDQIRSDQGHQIELIIGRDQLLIFLGFSLYPFSFHLYLSPFSLVLVLFANIFKSCNFKWPSIRRVAYLIHNAVP